MHKVLVTSPENITNSANQTASAWKQRCYNLLNAWRWTLSEELTVPVKKFPAFYGTRRFITVFTKARHLSPSWVKLMDSTTSYALSWRSILISSCRLSLGLPRSLLLSGFHTKTVCVPLASPIRATCSAHLFKIISILRGSGARGGVFG